jgi:hypothetical protein
VCVVSKRHPAFEISYRFIVDSSRHAQIQSMTTMDGLGRRTYVE